jgi:hypothetical protein
MTRLPTVLLCVLALAACSRPEPPEKDRPPEPTAATKPSREPPATQLRDYMQRDIKKAQAVEATVLDAGKQQAADIDAQTSGNAPAQQPAQ